jgi:hypothetical protein
MPSVTCFYSSSGWQQTEVRLLGSPGLKAHLYSASRYVADMPCMCSSSRRDGVMPAADRGQRAPLGCGQDKFQGNAMTAAAEIQRAAVLGSVVLLPATALAAGWWRNEP